MNMNAMTTEGDPFLERVKKFGFYALLALIGLFIGALLAYKMTQKGLERQEVEYIKARQISLLIDKGVGSVESRQKALDQLMTIVKNNPHLHSEYDSKIAQELLNEGRGKEAEAFADLAILRATNDFLPFYSDFSEVTLMTSKGDYRQALDKTLVLKAQMLQNLAEFKLKKQPKKFGDVLFAFNLLREVFLMQQVGDKAGEKRAWQEFSSYVGFAGAPPPKESLSREAFQRVAAEFNSGKENLATYMEQRLKNLQ